MRQTDRQTRLDWLDIAKGIAIVAVLIGHTSAINKNVQIYLYSWHMPIFFIVSGILLQYRDSWRYRSYKGIVVRKAKSLLYPYLTFSILTTIYSIKFTVGTSAIVMSFYKNIGANILVQDILGTILGIGIWLLWFLPALFFGELLAIVILKQSQHVHYIATSVLLLIIIVSPIGRNAYLASETQSVILSFIAVILLVIFRILVATTFLLIGYFIAEFKILDKINLAGALLLLTIEVLTSQLNQVDIRDALIGNPVLFFFNAIVSSIAILFLAKKVKALKIFDYLGRNSLLIFTLQGVGGLFFASYISNKLFSNSIILEMFEIILLILGETAATWIIVRWVKPLYDYRSLRKLIKNNNLLWLCKGGC